MGEEASNEDLIEATIRRVAASKAARLSDAPGGESEWGLHLVTSEADDDELGNVPPAERAPVDEDRISATLRRIAAEQAARAETGTSDAPDEGDVDEAATVDDSDPMPLATTEAAPDVDEDRIAATLRRIEAEQAARADAATVEPPSPNDEPVEDDSTTDDAEIVPVAAAEVLPAADENRITATLRRIEAEQAARATRAAPAPVASDERLDGASEAIARGASWEQVARELQRQLDATRSELHELSERFAALAGGAARPAPSVPTWFDAKSRALPDAAAGEWDDTPQLPYIPTGVLPRPVIIRDPSPETATAAQFDYDDPAPAIAPTVAEKQPEPSDAKRGFELLPRTYRITVEDKRRGVDLVPLHRALLGLDGVRDISLLSYSNGTAIVAAESTGELSPDVLGKAVSHAMAREVKVEVHNEQTMVIKLAED